MKSPNGHEIPRQLHRLITGQVPWTNYGEGSQQHGQPGRSAVRGVADNHIGGRTNLSALAFVATL